MKQLLNRALLSSLLIYSALVTASPDWNVHNPKNPKTIEHTTWQSFLNNNLITNDPRGINLVNYSEVSQKDRLLLTDYIHQLRTTDPTQYNRNEQMAYWINLYNALTVKLILENYPTKSIKKLGKGFFSFGPWDDEIIKIRGKVLSLNNIEHDILRPIFQDKRIHYAVNCASIGCPNLASEAYKAESLEQQLSSAACEYINHPRGVSVNDDELILSSIYKWYSEDFGTQNELLTHILDCAQPILKSKLEKWIANDSNDIEYEYDWSLNEHVPAELN